MRKFFVFTVLFYLRFWARLALKIHKPTIIGVAGSVGKSSARNAIYAILKDYFKVEYTSGNSETGVPLGVLGISLKGYSAKDWLVVLLQAPFRVFRLKKLDALIVEMGTDDPFPPKNMEYLLTVLKPDIAVFLNAAAAHTMQFEKALTQEEMQLAPDAKMDRILQRMAEEDGKIITRSGCKIGIYNTDNMYVCAEMKRFGQNENLVHGKPKTQLFSFGKDSSNNLFYGDYQVDLEKTTFLLKTIKGAIKLTFHGILLPKEYREVFGAAVLAGLEMGLNLEYIQTALEKNFSLPKGRGSLLKGIKDTALIDSSYNASRSAVEAFLELGNLLKKQTGRPFLFAFGDMNELGNESKEEHEAVAQKMAGIVDEVYLVGVQTKLYVLPILEKSMKKVFWFENTGLLGDFLAKNCLHSSIILFKGSQNKIFLEEAAKKLLLNPEDQKKLCRQEKYWKKGF